MDNIKYNYHDYLTDLQTLAVKLTAETERHTLIIGINRGGCIPSVQLSHKLHIPCVMINWSSRDGIEGEWNDIAKLVSNLNKHNHKVLIVDDIIDSGVAMNGLLNTLLERYDNIEVATLIYNTEVQLPVPVYSGQDIKRSELPNYFDFWWEL